MAIKGKGRTRGRRLVAAPPRPHLFIRKPPLWRRPWVYWPAAVVAVGALLFWVFFTLHLQHARAFEQRERRGVRAFTAQLTAAFPADRQVVPPDVFFFYRSLNDDLNKLSSGKLSAKDARKQGQAIVESASASASQIGSINVQRLIPADFTVSRRRGVHAKGLTQQEVSDAKFLIVRAFRTYEAVGKILEESAGLPEAERKALAGQAKTLASQALDLFARGYRTISSLRTRLGIQASIQGTQG
jgi:hypothetical protein